MKIGILGGTFNPIHIGHLILAEQVHDLLNLSKVFFVPAFIPPHKEVVENVSAKHRYKMVKLVTCDNEKFDISSIEIEEGKKSYTVYTLEKFRTMYPSDELFFIAGSDVLYEDWKDFSKVLDLAKFIVVIRPHHPISNNIDERIRTINIPLVDISSSKIRTMLKQGKSVRYLLPQRVIEYIEENRLYK